MQTNAEPESRAQRLLASLHATFPWLLGGGIVGALLGLSLVGLNWWLGIGRVIYAVHELRQPKSFWELAGEITFSWRSLRWTIFGVVVGLVTLITLWRTPKRRVGVLLALACPAVTTGYVFLISLRFAWAQEQWISGPVSEVLITGLVGATCGPLVKAYIRAREFLVLRHS
jgi:hypothetical protein